MLIGLPFAAMLLMLRTWSGVGLALDLGWYALAAVVLGIGITYLGYRIDRVVLEREARPKGQQ
jgi:hypothetical protein